MEGKKISPGLIIASLGVVFGDIGTSPLYAIRETLWGLPINVVDVLGVLSLVFWSLVIVISLKYLVVIFRADNEGQGGILALLALLKQKKTRYESLLYLCAIFGAGLLIGDGMLTPAISVTSAIEGLEVLSPHFEKFVIPLSCGIILCLFLVQSKGTGKIGIAFGPVLIVWFLTIGLLGLIQIIANPMVLKAIHPYYAFEFFRENGLKGFFLLGGVFLVVTGGEALYADIGHFGKNPIRYSWFFIALPGLLLNYFGQCANLLLHPENIVNPFYKLAPPGFFIPLLIISTMATIIASQAMISATFSLTRQAVLLGLYPRLPIIQTSRKYVGQIYIPQVNLFLLIGTLVLIFTFKNSSGLAHAYGIAVNMDMLMVTVMVAYAARKIWRWSLWQVILVFSGLILVDLIFLTANSHKFLTGGWVPICFALFVAFIMYTWRNGLRYLKKNYYLQKEDISKIVKQLHYKTLNQLPGLTAIFITDIYDRSGGSFLHFLKLSLAVPENILIVNYTVRNKPHIYQNHRYKVTKLDDTFYKVTLRYGFMDNISIPDALQLLNEKKLLPFKVNVDSATYMVEIPNIMASREKSTLMFFWQEKLFAFLMRNYSVNLNIEFYNLPYNRTIAIGTYCQI
ncbi:potassium transporter Kup [Legionella spiritensis]|uniref:Probable potassium transport system protein Kup n=1 Tax=Legionella spiritensis TaxID=452 RepID=A0A0W0Z800_LEGSP|nr:KUP/HAK/KT family potassium transporter [Legionella spiritensis]KTD65248.1 KUP system potassium uptake protein [Legionella spiritensis]SNV30306.1 KUP system potassium uptake protein [Legionella spiritensis]